MWYNVDQNGYRWDELMNLYRMVEQRERSYRDDLFRFTNFYSAVCYAILGITLSGFVALHNKGLICLALLFGPIMTMCMCWLGLRLTSRIFHRVIEEVSTKAKLENILGLDHTINVTQFLGKQAIWPKDDCLLPPRHAARRFKEDASAPFIETASHSGFFRDNRLYFGLIALFAAFLSVAILLAALVSK